MELTHKETPWFCNIQPRMNGSDQWRMEYLETHSTPGLSSRYLRRREKEMWRAALRGMMEWGGGSSVGTWRDVGHIVVCTLGWAICLGLSPRFCMARPLLLISCCLLRWVTALLLNPFQPTSLSTTMSVRWEVARHTCLSWVTKHLLLWVCLLLTLCSLFVTDTTKYANQQSNSLRRH